LKKKRVLLLTMVITVTLVLSNFNFVSAQSLKSTKTNETTQTLTISVAASLKDVFLEAQRNFEKQNKTIKLLFNFGGSGTLEKQIEAGAPVDLFVSADVKNIKKLDDKNLIDKSSIQDIATNQLVLVAYKASAYNIKNINDLTKDKIVNISLGTLGSVPAGDYAKETLTYYNLWDKVKNKIAYAKDVTAVLNYVKMGNADAGFVYLTDAKRKSDAIIKLKIPNETHSPIVYEGAIISSTKYKEASKKFMNYLSGTQAQIILGKYGFGKAKK
jgi:molybdate transport system substrate-binding protein